MITPMTQCLFDMKQLICAVFNQIHLDIEGKKVRYLSSLQWKGKRQTGASGAALRGWYKHCWAASELLLLGHM